MRNNTYTEGDFDKCASSAVSFTTDLRTAQEQTRLNLLATMRNNTYTEGDFVLTPFCNHYNRERFG